MKKTIPFALAGITLSFLAGYWANRPATTDKENHTQTTPQVEINSPTRLAPPRSLEEKPLELSSSQHSEQNNKHISPEMKQMIADAQSQQEKMMLKQLTNQFDIHIATLTEELGLDENQEDALRSYFQNLVEKSGSNPMANREATAALAAALRGEGLIEHMSSHLNAQQLEKIEEIQQRKKSNQIESEALKNLSKLQQSLNLTEDQKDQIYDLLLEDAEQHIDSESDAELLTNTMMSGMGIELDLESMGFSELFNMSNTPNPTITDQASIIKRMAEARQNSIDRKVERLSSILSENQQEKYRQSLEAKGNTNNSMIQFKISQ